MDKLTFNDLVTRYGKNQAYDLLLTIEKLARIKNSDQLMDEEKRLQAALDVINETNFAA